MSPPPPQPTHQHQKVFGSLRLFDGYGSLKGFLCRLFCIFFFSLLESSVTTRESITCLQSATRIWIQCYKTSRANTSLSFIKWQLSTNSTSAMPVNAKTRWVSLTTLVIFLVKDLLLWFESRFSVTSVNCIYHMLLVVRFDMQLCSNGAIRISLSTCVDEILSRSKLIHLHIFLSA